MGIKNTKTYKRGFKDAWEQAKQQAVDICKADIQEHAITISAAQQETHNNCCNYLAKAIGSMSIRRDGVQGESK